MSLCVMAFYRSSRNKLTLATRPRDHHLRKDVDQEYVHLAKTFQSREKEKEYSFEEYSFDEILGQIKVLQLKGEICGKWLWLSDRVHLSIRIN